MAYDSVSQMGYVILGLGIGGLGVSFYEISANAVWLAVAAGGLVAGLFHLLNHSLFKSLLFFSAGVIEHQAGTKNLNQLGGLYRVMPITGVLMLIGSLSVAGVPLLNGFNSKWMIFNAAIAAQVPILAFLAIFTSAFTFAVFLKVYSSIFLGTTPKVHSEVKDASVTMLAPSVVLAIGCILLGIFPQLALVYLLFPAVSFLLPLASLPPFNPFDSLLSFFGGVWDPFWLFTILMIGIVVGYLLFRLKGSSKEAEEPDDKTMPFTGGALEAPYLDVDTARPTSTVFEYPFRSVLQSMQKTHTGLINNYVLWIMVFALVFLGAAFLGWI